MDEIYLTRDGYNKLMTELKNLKAKRKELSQAIGEARDHGDISENAEYDAAKDAQGFNEMKIAQLEEKLSFVQILEDENIGTDEVLIGAKVKLVDLNTQQEREYTLLSELEADYTQGIISTTSPVGSALLNHKVNDIVEIKLADRTLKYKILKISR